MAVTGRIRDIGQNILNLFLEQVVAPPVISIFSSLSHSSRRPVLEM